MPGIDFSQLVSFGQTVIILFLILLFVLRFSPRWERVKTREVQVREIEANSRIAQAESLTKLAGVIKDVAIAQSKTTEQNDELRIFLRAAMREHEVNAKRLSTVEDCVDDIKNRLKDA